jgi:hypothetical protein
MAVDLDDGNPGAAVLARIIGFVTKQVDRGGCAPVTAHSIKAFDVDRKLWMQP